MVLKVNKKKQKISNVYSHSTVMVIADILVLIEFDTKHSYVPLSADWTLLIVSIDELEISLSLCFQVYVTYGWPVEMHSAETDSPLVTVMALGFITGLSRSKQQKNILRYGTHLI